MDSALTVHTPPIDLYATGYLMERYQRMAANHRERTGSDFFQPDTEHLVSGFTNQCFQATFFQQGADIIHRISVFQGQLADSGLKTKLAALVKGEDGNFDALFRLESREFVEIVQRMAASGLFDKTAYKFSIMKISFPDKSLEATIYSYSTPGRGWSSSEPTVT